MRVRSIKTLALASIGLYGLSLPSTVMACPQGQNQGKFLPAEAVLRPELQHTINHKFGNSTLDEVLAWMSLDEVSFVADAALSPATRKVSLDFAGVKLCDCMTLVATEVDGKWEKRGDIYMLIPASGGSELEAYQASQASYFVPATLKFSIGMQEAPKPPPTPPAVASSGSTRTTVSTPAVAAQGLPAKAADTTPGVAGIATAAFAPAQAARAAQSSDWAARFEERMNRIEAQLKRIEELLKSGGMPNGLSGDMKFMPSMPPMPAMPATPFAQKGQTFIFGGDASKGDMEKWTNEMKVFKLDMEKWAKDHKGQMFMKTIPDMNLKSFAMPKLDERQHAELMKELEMAGKARGDSILELKESSKARAQVLKELEKAHVLDGRAFAEMKIEMPEIKVLRGKALDKTVSESVAKSMARMHMDMQKDGAHVWTFSPDSHFTMGSANVKEAIGSLTDAQKATIKKRGYLVPSELSERQKKLLGGLPEGKDWSVSFSIDGKKIAVRSK